MADVYRSGSEDRSADPGPTATLTELSRLLTAADDTIEVLRQLVKIAVYVLPGRFEASLTIMGANAPATVAYTSDAVLPIDTAQYETGKGPCVDAARIGKPLRVDATEAAERWPEFTEAARQAGLLGYLSSPLLLDGECIGAFNLFSAKANEFDGMDEAFLTLFATAALAAVVSARRSADARQLADQFEHAMRTRQYIGEATGVLAERHQLDPETAFQLLVQQSQNTNVKLRDLALAITGRKDDDASS